MNRRRFLKILGAVAAAGVAASYPVTIERYLVQVNRYRIPMPRLPREFDGFTIVHLTDLHYGPLVPLWFVRWVIETANRLRKHITVCTGDYVGKRNKRQDLEQVWPVLAELRAPLGVYSVLGNHDHWTDTTRSLQWLQRSGQNVRKRCQGFERNGNKLWIAGGGDLWEDHIPFDDLLDDVPKSDCRIVLAHNPDSADTKFSAPVDLIISGHTHGGQVCVPFYGSLILPVKNKNYSFGLKANSKGQPVFISKGIGWAMYPVRFNCMPEIAVLELTSSTL
ncbi:MAG: metallophosphoesterase [Candidatus Hydrogenedentes bacterium]|nr:metallophosphoesterase [Candidatus Hydrogenedentota bacterium]